MTKKDINKIKIDSGTLGSSDRNIFLTDNCLVVDDDVIKFTDIEKIEVSGYKPTDTIAISIYLTNLILIWYTMFILSLGLIYTLLLLVLIMFVTYIVIKFVRTDIESYVSIDTENMKYLVGVVHKKDLDMLLNINES